MPSNPCDLTLGGTFWARDPVTINLVIFQGAKFLGLLEAELREAYLSTQILQSST